MKKLKFISLGLFFFIKIFSPTLSLCSEYAILEAQKVKFQYHIGIFLFEGFFTLQDSIFVIDFKNPSASKLRLQIDLNSSSAGFFLATSAMLGESVLHVEKYPRIIFESKRISVKGHEFTIVGDATIRGITKGITLAAILQNPETLDSQNKSNLKFQILAKLNRRDFNATGYANVVGDVIDLNSTVDLVTKD